MKFRNKLLYNKYNSKKDLNESSNILDNKNDNSDESSNILDNKNDNSDESNYHFANNNNQYFIKINPINNNLSFITDAMINYQHDDNMKYISYNNKSDCLNSYYDMMIIC